MQGSSPRHLNGHAEHFVQIEQYLESYGKTGIWEPEALELLARFRNDVRLWSLILDRAADLRVFPLDVEKAVDQWRAKHSDKKNSHKKPREPILLALSDILPVDVEWLWQPYIPLGKLTLLEGDPETGKTWLSLAIGANMTYGRALPNFQGTAQQDLVPRRVIYMQAEDDIADTIRPRFDALGGDPSRLFILSGYRQADCEDEGITLQDLDIIESVLADKRPALLVIDPLQAYLGANVDMYRANQTRPLLTALSRLATRYSCALLCIRHLSKSGQDRAIYRGLGSIDFAAAARSVLIAGFDPEDPTRRRRVLVHSKSSLAPQGSSLGYELRDGQFFWLGQSTVSVDQLFARHRDEEEQSDLDEAICFLNGLLAGSLIPAKVVMKEAKKAGISEKTLRRAKKQIGVKSWRENVTAGSAGSGQWLWTIQDGR